MKGPEGFLLGDIDDQNLDSVESEKRHSPIQNVRAYVADLAHAYGVIYEETPFDRLAKSITELAGDAVDFDETELLILALERVGVIPREMVVSLVVAHNRELGFDQTTRSATN